ncbi:ornithine cyclodeaminase [Brevirhabdus pacifica]|uniref:Ornithine cyclodeaminase n=1 Tax=Brevirhabdus pacifica TaxID=1267768 RepID=A0A1U7DHZ9_9RHOB|nr:ornithine cyclodeaminase family protein [Brevirhabdus pacifica]APX89498.1 ornithine cyclodeaminase [Brevirhabdus pacifica]OWU76494.1 ornithine cyclodeaminase [Loktanella sp. 22II-4b]PJJ85850.1 alanine dehydrogenase [Brevirhabdus pacifica]
MLIVDNALVARLLDMPGCIAAQESAFAGLDSGRSIHRPRIDMYVPCQRDDGYYRWGTMEGANNGVFAIRMKSDIVHWPRAEDGTWTEEKYCVEPGTFCGLIMLMSTETGEPLAFINDGALQHMRVGGGAALGAKYLAREDAETVGMIGSGGMARTFLEGFTCVRSIKRCRVFSPSRANRESFATEMSDKLGVEVIPVATAREAVAGCDILSTCTDSMEPVYDADWLEPGMHVTNLGRREMPEEAMPKFDVVIRQGTAGLQMEQTERFQAERGHSPAAFIGGTAEEMERLPKPNPRPGFGGDDPKFTDRGQGGSKPDFCALINGRAAGRQNDRQITFYRNVGNQGLQFSAVGQLVYRKALAEGGAREIPTEWFLQDIRN